MKHTAIIGAGSWGTALALLASADGRQVVLWERDPQTASVLQSERRNARYLPDNTLPESVEVVSDLQYATRDAEIIIVAVPSHALTEITALLAECKSQPRAVLSASKGLDPASGRRLSQILAEGIPDVADKIAVLSGPNLAVEIARGIPTATVIASASHDAGSLCRDLLGCPSFRVYLSTDVVGVELGGALKNVMAIGAGIGAGLGFGDNTRAAFLTRGLAEMVRLGVRLGARAETFSGLSGIGDLIATASSHLSRNFRLGLALGQGKDLQTALTEIHQVAEGVPATQAAYRLMQQSGVEMPITQELHGALFEGRQPQQCLHNLLSRSWKDEA